LPETCRSRWPARQLTVAYTPTRPVAAGGDRRLPGILNGRLLAPTIGSKLLRQFWIELAAFLRIA
jgi:hypothetical protein